MRIPGSAVGKPIKYSESLRLEPSEARLVRPGTSSQVIDPAQITDRVEVAGQRGRNVPLTNSDVLKNLESPIPVEASVSYAKNGRGATITTIKPDSVAAWGRLRTSVDLPEDIVARIDAAAKAVADTTEPALSGDKSSATAKAIQQAYTQFKTALLDGYAKASVEDQRQVAKTLIGVQHEQRAWAVSADPTIFKGLQTTSSASPSATTAPAQEEKAAYTAERVVFPPRMYKNIFKATRSAVGIANGEGTEPFASGTIIGENLVLTCAHQVVRPSRDGVQNPPLNKLRILISYELPADRDYPGYTVNVKDVLFAGVAESEAGPPLDFALLEIDAPPGTKLPAPMPITTEAIEAEQAFFVIGHPNKMPMRVSDGARVLYPNSITPEKFLELEAHITGSVDETRARNDLLASFRQAYRPVEVQGKATEEYRFRLGGMSAIGAICNTSHGNSGGPAVLRDEARMFGILISGMPDAPSPYQAGWGRHETLLPIRPVIEQIDTYSAKPNAKERLRNWRQTFKVRIDGSASD